MTTMDTSKLLSDQLRGLRGSIESISEDAGMKQLCASFLEDAVGALSYLHQTHPQAKQNVDHLALAFASLATCLAAYFADRACSLEEEKRRGAEITNTQHDLVVAVAQSVAFREWQADTAQKIRIGEMVHKVWAQMIDLGYQDYLPDKPDSLRDWIRPIAKEHFDFALVGGRPRKTP